MSKLLELTMSMFYGNQNRNTDDVGIALSCMHDAGKWIVFELQWPAIMCFALVGKE